MLSLPVFVIFVFFFSSRRRHTRFDCDWSSDVCSSDLITWDAANSSFVVVSFGGPAVFSWKSGDKAPTVIARGPGAWDGVEVLADGRIIASSWADSTVDVVASGKVARLISGVPSPADIGLDTKRNRVLIPILQQDRVEVWQLPAK